MKQLVLVAVLVAAATSASATCVRGHYETPRDTMGFIDMFSTPRFVCDEHSFSSSQSRSDTAKMRDGRRSNSSNKDWDGYSSCRESGSVYECQHWIKD